MRKTSGQGKFEPHLRSPRYRDARWDATTRGAVKTQLFAYQLVLAADPERTLELMLQAFQSPHPHAAMWVLRNLDETLPDESRRRILEIALAFEHSAVRAAAVPTLRSIRVRGRARPNADGAVRSGPRATACRGIRAGAALRRIASVPLACSGGRLIHAQGNDCGAGAVRSGAPDRCGTVRPLFA